MGELGETLKNRRINLGISLAEAEEATKIRQKYLEALENEDYASLPGMVYAKGFLRNYARYLQLDPDDLSLLLPAWERKTKTEIMPLERLTSKPVFTKPKKSGKSYIRIFLTALVAVIILLLVNTFWERPKDDMFSNNKTSKAQDTQTSNPKKNGAEDTSATKNPQTGQPVQSGGAGQSPNSSQAGQGQSGDQPVQEAPAQSQPGTEQGAGLVLNATAGKCWMQVWGDAKLIYEGTLIKGQSKEFTGYQKFKVKYGNAGAITVKYNGKDLGIAGPYGKVITAVYPADSH